MMTNHRKIGVVLCSVLTLMVAVIALSVIGCGIERVVFLVNRSEQVLTVYADGYIRPVGILEPGARVRLPYIGEPPTNNYYVDAENQRGELVFTHNFDYHRNEWNEIPSSGGIPTYEISIPLQGLQSLPITLVIRNQTGMTLIISVNGSSATEVEAGAVITRENLPVLKPPSSGRTVRIVGTNNQGQMVMDYTEHLPVLHLQKWKVVLSQSYLVPSQIPSTE